MTEPFRGAGLRVSAGLPPAITDWIAASLAGTAAGPPDSLAECRADGFELELAVRTLDEVARCCRLVGVLFGLPVRSVTGIRELLVNGVEHGNLEIGFEEKSALLASGDWQDEIVRRSNLRRYRDRHALLAARVAGRELEVRIRDAGSGFDWRPYIDAPVPPTSGRHGRGIVLARAAGFSAFAYAGCGNEVVVRTRLQG